MPEPSESASATAEDERLTDAQLSDEEEADDAEEQQRRVLRASGALLLSFAVIAVLMNLATATTGASSWVPLVIDIAVGGSLLSGDARAKSLAIFRASAGLLFSVALLFGALSVGKNDVAAVLVVQSLVSFSLLVLLWGHAGRARFRLGLSVGVVAGVLNLAMPLLMIAGAAASREAQPPSPIVD